MRIVAAAAIAVALTAVPSAAQSPPQPVLQGWGGSVLGTFNLTDLEPGMDRASGFGLEADLRLPGTVLSFVGHVSDTGAASFRGVGPRVMHGIKCALVDGAEKCRLSVFGHYLFGDLTAGGIATAGLDAKKGGGVEVPLRGPWVLRIGADHDGATLNSVVGIGARF